VPESTKRTFLTLQPKQPKRRDSILPKADTCAVTANTPEDGGLAQSTVLLEEPEILDAELLQEEEAKAKAES